MKTSYQKPSIIGNLKTLKPKKLKAFLIYETALDKFFWWILAHTFSYRGGACPRSESLLAAYAVHLAEGFVYRNIATYKPKL